MNNSLTFKNNVNHKILSSLLVCNSKSIFLTSNSFVLIMSHFYFLNLQSSTTWKKYREEIHSSVNQLMNGLMNINTLSQNCLKEMNTSIESTSKQSVICKEVATKFQDLLDKQNGGRRCGEKGAEKGCRFILVLDDNMFYRSMRYEYYQLARKCELKLWFHYCIYQTEHKSHEKNKQTQLSKDSSPQVWKLCKYLPQFD